MSMLAVGDQLFPDGFRAAGLGIVDGFGLLLVRHANCVAFSAYEWRLTLRHCWEPARYPNLTDIRSSLIAVSRQLAQSHYRLPGGPRWTVVAGLSYPLSLGHALDGSVAVR